MENRETGVIPVRTRCCNRRQVPLATAIFILWEGGMRMTRKPEDLPKC